MQDQLFILDHLSQFFDEVSPKEFYRALFPVGEFERQGEQETGKYNGIAVELLPKSDDGANARRFVITDELAALDQLLESDNFIIISPISYIGRSRQSANARNIYALAIDLDGISDLQHLVDFLHQVEIEHLPRPTYLVWSGSGLHLYYQLERPVPCFANIVKQLSALKTALTRRIWNGYVTDLSERPQIESLFQGFRMVGGITKGGNRTRAFHVGDPVGVDYLNTFVPKDCQVTEFRYKSKLTLRKAAALYPDWYERRVVQGKPKGSWTANRAVYDWWLDRLRSSIQVGHRYYGVMVLSVYAKKCGIDRSELEADAFSLVDMLDQLTTDENNRFTRSDVFSALEAFNDNFIRFPIDKISALTAIPIQKNKRNGRPQSLHLRIARSTKSILKDTGELVSDGRPSMRSVVELWRKDHAAGTVSECVSDTGLSRSTVYKYWNLV